MENAGEATEDQSAPLERGEQPHQSQSNGGPSVLSAFASDSKRNLESELEETGSDETHSNYRKIRDDITQRIEELIIQLNPSLDQQKASVLARHLDAKLHASSTSFEAYADPHSLDERLKALARGMGLQLRRQRLSFNGGNPFAGERKKLLRQRIGSELYGEVFRLVVEVEEIRKTNGTWTWISQRKVPSAGGNQKQASMSMPSGLTAIYFGTRLVEAQKALVANTTSLQLERVDKPNWEELVKEAKENVAAFREMENEAKAMQTCGLKKATCAFSW